MANQTHNIIVYSTPTCQFCHRLKEYLKEKGCAFEDKDVSQNPSAAQEMIEKSGQIGVPVIDIDGQIVVGFNRSILENLLAG